MSLKELTIKQHQNAERQHFASTLMSGNISKELYLKYIVNQLQCYSALENHTLFKLPDERLKRVENIQEDIAELQNKLQKNNKQLLDMITQSTKNYKEHVKRITNEADFLAHIYVRYLGDLRGGQMIAKKIPGSGKYYQFKNSLELANSIYKVINDEMADEAKIVFNFATKLFIEMHESE
tara:strand:- start:1691 stop:2230 length:540 start_codon:yes stop_codon:yes gene_type:complete